MTAAYDAQLAGRAAEMLPGIGTDERLELLGVMDPVVAWRKAGAE